MKFYVLYNSLAVLALLGLYGCEKDKSSGKIPGAPSDFEAVAIASNQIKLTWTDNAYNENGFKIECAAGGTSDFSEIVTQSPNSTSYVHGMLMKSTKYSYRIYAFNDAGYSKFAADSAMTLESNITIPLSPSNVTATAISSSQIVITWSDNSDNEDGFIVRRWNEQTVNPEADFPVGKNVTNFTDNGLLTVKTYGYTVFAFNVAGTSIQSSKSTATTF